MKTALNLLLAAVIVTVLTGCGSISARWRGERGKPYPGVRMAADTVTHYTREGELIAIFDMPLSAVVDTIMLPWDLTAQEQAAPAPSE